MTLRGLIAAGIAASLALALPALAGAVIIAPTTGADDFGTVPSTCSLREAVQAANTNAAVDTCPAGSPGADTIVLAGGESYERLITGSNENANASGDLDIVAGEPVTIQVSGQGLVKISGTGLTTGDRVLDNYANGTMIDGVEIADGNVQSQGGGGIRSTGTLTVRNSTVTENTAGSFGGGIANGDNTTLTATNVTVFDNQASETGGGIDSGSGGTVTLNNVSIIGNSVAATGIPTDGGGGFFVFGNMTTLTLGNSIVEGNIDTSLPSPQASDCDANGLGQIFTSAGYNLIGSLNGCPLTPTTGDLIGTSAALGPLGANGGGSRTLPIQFPSSPAFNAGNNVLAPGSGGAACAATDQRGILRPQEGRCDIGAFELVVPTPVPINTHLQPAMCAGAVPACGFPIVPVNPKCKKKGKKKGKKAGASAKKKGCKKPKKRK